MDMRPRGRTISALLAARAQEHGDDVLYTFLADGETESASLSYGRLDMEARALAGRLRDHCARGDRALILIPDGADFVRAFMACQYAGVIAVPAYPPLPIQSARRAETLTAIAHDCGARVALAAGPQELVDLMTEAAPALAQLDWVFVDAPAAGEAASDRELVAARPDDVAFLQYTSGSTSVPKGVVVTHEALLCNEELIRRCWGVGREDVVVGWLPLFHDMGLIGNVLHMLYVGARAVLMPPLAFVQRPGLWLDAITRYSATISGGPDFAYALCVRRIPAEERTRFELGSWRLAFNGAEPVRAATIDAFTDAFSASGFDPRAWRPCYGLAESTLLVTGEPDREATRMTVDSGELHGGRLVPGGDRPLVASGTPILHRRVEIVDPETCVRRRPGEVGEIWVAGPDVCAGYWGRDEESRRTFAASLADTGEGPFLRTGDLGALFDGHLYVTGRLKDLIIVGGANHYPHDIEATVESSHSSIRRGCSVAFALERDGREHVVVVAEVKPAHGTDGSNGEIERAARSAVAADHGIQVDEVVLVPPHTVPKTSSGKLQRRACRAALESGELERIGVPDRRRMQEVV